MQRFSSLKNLATYMSWGRKVFSPHNILTCRMGNGHFPLGLNIGTNAIYYKVKIVDETNHHLIDLWTQRKSKLCFEFREI